MAAIETERPSPRYLGIDLWDSSDILKAMIEAQFAAVKAVRAARPAIKKAARAIEARLKDFSPKSDIRQEQGDLFHGDYQVTDPYGQVVSLSTHQFHAPKVERTFPCIRHIAVCVPNNDEVLDFYVNVFGFRESTTSKKIRAQNRVVRWAADGETAMAILPDRTRRDMNERESPRDGLNHFGWLVTDIEHFLNSLPEGCISQRPSSRPMAEYRGFDLDRNPFDISQDKGYEIDVDRWVHG